MGAPIAVEVSGENFHEVGEYAASVRRQLAEIEGSAKLSDNYRVGRPEMRLKIDRGAAKRVGASTQSVARYGPDRDRRHQGIECPARRRGRVRHHRRARAPVPGRHAGGHVPAHPRPRGHQPGHLRGARSRPSPAYELAGGSGSIRHIDQDLVVTIQGDRSAEGYNEDAVRRGGPSRSSIEYESAGSRILPAPRRGPGRADRRPRTSCSRAFADRGVPDRASCWSPSSTASTCRSSSSRRSILSLIGVLWGLILTGTPFGIIMTGTRGDLAGGRRGQQRDRPARLRRADCARKGASAPRGADPSGHGALPPGDPHRDDDDPRPRADGDRDLGRLRGPVRPIPGTRS